MLLYQWRLLFGWLPIETLIRERQDEYYHILGECDKAADSGQFIEFLLKVILDALEEIQVTNQVKKLLVALGNKELSAKELMEKIGLKHHQTFRKDYLLPALEAGRIEMTVLDKPNSSKQKYKKIKQPSYPNG